MSDTRHTKPTMIIKDFFGYRNEEHRKQVDGKPISGLQDFALEMKALSDAEKIDMARLAAKEMGYNAAQIGAIAF